MLFLYLLLLLLPIAQGLGDKCRFNSRIHKAAKKSFDCLRLRSRYRVAQCLLQRNSLDYTMQCAGWKRDERLWFDISENPLARDNDILPSLDSFDVATNTWNRPTWYGDDDDKLAFTPRGLIVAAAEKCVSVGICRRSFFGQVLACPHEDMREFIPCLKCWGTTAKDIDNFEEFIRGDTFGTATYRLTTSAMQWRKYADLTTCDDEPDPDEDGDDDNIRIKARDDGGSYVYTYTRSIRYPISDAPTPDITTPSSEPTQTAGDDETDEDVSTDVVAATKTVKRQEAAATTTSPAKNGTGRYAVVNVSVLGMLSLVATLLLM